MAHVCSVCYQPGEFAQPKGKHRASPSNCCEGCSCGGASQPERFRNPNAPSYEQVLHDREMRAKYGADLAGLPPEMRGSGSA